MKRLVSLFLVLCVLLVGTVCSAEESIEVKGTATVNWSNEPVAHGNFTDLGDYVIDLGVITQEDYEKGLAIVNSKVDMFQGSCTGIVKRNSEGEVIMGRNMDLEVSNNAAFIAHFVGGKYQAVGFGYNNHSEYSYADLQAMDNLPDGYREMQAAAVMDAFNEAGLYIQTNMRTGNGHLSSGTNPGGKRICMGALNAIVAQNCGTVAEALEFIQTELDVYSSGSTGDGAARSGWDGALMIGDATGEYGVIEFVNNQMYYTPYANGHGNAYVNPNLYIYNEYCAGFGRLALAQQAMIGAETADDMMEAIHKADWCREVQDIQYSYKDEQGNVHFVDKDGNPSIDYRTELTMMLCVDDEGHYIPDSNEWIQCLTSIATGEAFSFLDSTMYNLYESDSEENESALTEWVESLGEITAEYLSEEDLNAVTEWEKCLLAIAVNPLASLAEVEQTVLIDWFEELQAMGIDPFGALTEEDQEALTEWVKSLKTIGSEILMPLSEEDQEALTTWAENLAEIIYDACEQFFRAEQEAQTAWMEGLQTIALGILEHYHSNCNVQWLTDNANFEEVKQGFTDYFTGLNAFELLEKFFAGDEQPLRDSGEIFTTGMNFGVNCSEKYLKVRFLEHADCVYEYQW